MLFMAISEDRYQRLWKSIVNVLKNSGLSISRIAKAGSRARQQHRPDSDMDVIFAVARDPMKRFFYPQLIPILRANFPEERVYAGTTYNVIHMDLRKGGNIDLVLLSEYEFDQQHGKDVEYRRSYL